MTMQSQKSVDIFILTYIMGLWRAIMPCHNLCEIAQGVFKMTNFYLVNPLGNETTHTSYMGALDELIVQSALWAARLKVNKEVVRELFLIKDEQNRIIRGKKMCFASFTELFDYLFS